MQNSILHDIVKPATPNQPRPHPTPHGCVLLLRRLARCCRGENWWYCTWHDENRAQRQPTYKMSLQNFSSAFMQTFVQPSTDDFMPYKGITLSDHVRPTRPDGSLTCPPLLSVLTVLCSVHRWASRPTTLREMMPRSKT